MRVLVTGGRDFNNAICVAEVLGLILGDEPTLTLIHGGARGADTLAEQWAHAMNRQCRFAWCRIEKYTADWSRGKVAGIERNQLMLDAGKPTLVIAFPGGRGTADMIRRAKAAGILVLEVTPA